MKPDVKPVASQRVADEIARRILGGELAPGTRIKQEELAADLDASRLPVRDALRMLEARGLVVLRPNSGAWVSELNRHDLVLSYEIRERIEPLLLLDSLPRLQPEDFAYLRELHAQIEASRDVEEFLRLDREFHWTTYRAHNAPQLAVMIENLWDTTQHYRREFTRLAGSSRRWVTCYEHRLLVEALERRDADAAEGVLALHVRRTRIELSSHDDLFQA